MREYVASEKWGEEESISFRLDSSERTSQLRGMTAPSLRGGRWSPSEQTKTSLADIHSRCSIIFRPRILDCYAFLNVACLRYPFAVSGSVSVLHKDRMLQSLEFIASVLELVHVASGHCLTAVGEYLRE